MSLTQILLELSQNCVDCLLHVKIIYIKNISVYQLRCLAPNLSTLSCDVWGGLSNSWRRSSRLWNVPSPAEQQENSSSDRNRVHMWGRAGWRRESMWTVRPLNEIVRRGGQTRRRNRCFLILIPHPRIINSLNQTHRWLNPAPHSRPSPFPQLTGRMDGSHGDDENPVAVQREKRCRQRCGGATVRGESLKRSICPASPQNHPEMMDGWIKIDRKYRHPPLFFLRCLQWQSEILMSSLLCCFSG